MGPALKKYLATRAKLAVDIDAIRSEWKDNSGEMPGDVQERLQRCLNDYDLNETLIRAEEVSAANAQRAGGPSLLSLTEGEGAPDEQRQGIQPGFLGRQLRNAAGHRMNFAPDEQRAMQADVNTNGGYITAPPTFVAELIRSINSALVFRELARVFPNVPLNGMGAPSLDSGLDDAEWTGEITEGKESEIRFGKRELKPKILRKAAKVSNLLVADAVFDMEALILEEFTLRFGTPQEKGFMVGTGQNQPLGVFTASEDGISTSRDITSAASLQIGADDFIDLYHAIKEGYRANATWLLNGTVVKDLRKKKDGQGNYLWAPISAGETRFSLGFAGTILGRPYVESEYVPGTVAAGKYVAAFGDMSKYWIADHSQLLIQRLVEKYALQGMTGFIGTFATDGQPILEEAFARLKVKA